MPAAKTLSVRSTNAIIMLGDLGRATVKEVGQGVSVIAGLVACGFVAQDGTIKAPGVGRPANAYKLTRKGKGRYTTLSRA